MAAATTGAGFWLVAADGGVFAFGDARYLGSAVGRVAGSAIVGMAAVDEGYWLVSSSGAIFPFGDAGAHGSLAGRRLSQPIVGIALSRPGGGGYWLVARDGGVFAFGDAPFVGSTGALRLNQPIVAITPPPFLLGESIAPGAYREQSDNHPSFTIQGGVNGHVVAAGRVLGGSERLGFTVPGSLRKAERSSAGKAHGWAKSLIRRSLRTNVVHPEVTPVELLTGLHRARRLTKGRKP